MDTLTGDATLSKNGFASLTEGVYFKSKEYAPFNVDPSQESGQKYKKVSSLKSKMVEKSAKCILSQTNQNLHEKEKEREANLPLPCNKLGT